MSEIGALLRVRLDLRHELFVTVQVMRRDRAVDGLAVPAVVPRRHERGNQFALARRERVGPTQQDVDERVQRRGGLRAERHQPTNAGQTRG